MGPGKVEKEQNRHFRPKRAKRRKRTKRHFLHPCGTRTQAARNRTFSSRKCQKAGKGGLFRVAERPGMSAKVTILTDSGRKVKPPYRLGRYSQKVVKTRNGDSGGFVTFAQNSDPSLSCPSSNPVQEVRNDHFWDQFWTPHDLGAPCIESLALTPIMASEGVSHYNIPVCTAESGKLIRLEASSNRHPAFARFRSAGAQAGTKVCRNPPLGSSF